MKTVITIVLLIVVCEAQVHLNRNSARRLQQELLKFDVSAMLEGARLARRQQALMFGLAVLALVAITLIWTVTP